MDAFLLELQKLFDFLVGFEGRGTRRRRRDIKIGHGGEREVVNQPAVGGIGGRGCISGLIGIWKGGDRRINGWKRWA